MPVIRCANTIAAVTLMLAAAACSGRHGIEPSAPGEPVTVTVTGQVFEGTSKGLPGVRVEVLTGPQAGGAVVTDGEGRFTIPGLLAGMVSLRASKPNYTTSTQGAIVVPGSNTNFKFFLQPFGPLVVHFSGVVTDGAGGSRVPGAEISIRWPTTGGTVSDANGAYDFTLAVLPPDPERPDRWWGPAAILAQKAGHEPDERYVQLAPQTPMDFRLYPITRLAPGTATRLTILADDPECYEVSLTYTELSWPCRTVRLTPTQNGVLTIGVQWENGATSLGLQVRDGGRGWPCCDNAQSGRVAAGTELLVDVVLINGRLNRLPPPGPESFLLTTSFARE